MRDDEQRRQRHRAAELFKLSKLFRLMHEGLIMLLNNCGKTFNIDQVFIPTSFLVIKGEVLYGYPKIHLLALSSLDVY